MLSIGFKRNKKKKKRKSQELTALCQCSSHLKLGRNQITSETRGNFYLGTIYFLSPLRCASWKFYCGTRFELCFQLLGSNPVLRVNQHLPRRELKSYANRHHPEQLLVVKSFFFITGKRSHPWDQEMKSFERSHCTPASKKSKWTNGTVFPDVRRTRTSIKRQKFIAINTMRELKGLSCCFL